VVVRDRPLVLPDAKYVVPAAPAATRILAGEPTGEPFRGLWRFLIVDKFPTVKYLT
jgi:hypothetical protein